MKKIMPFLIMILFLIIANGCQNSSKPEKKTAHSEAESKPAEAGGIVAGSVVPTMSWVTSDGKIKIGFHIKNQTEHIVHYHFGTDKQWDFTIETMEGKQIYQLSQNKSYSSNKKILTLKQGEEADFTAELPALPKGEYKVKIWLTSNEDGPQIEKKINTADSAG